jgi:hypothetical protein
MGRASKERIALFIPMIYFSINCPINFGNPKMFGVITNRANAYKRRVLKGTMIKLLMSTMEAS